jgi:hypothetical protein
MPPPPDQGKKHVGKRLEDDELFKQIGGQLDADFDYSQWQRTGKTADVKTKVKKEPAKESDGECPLLGNIMVSMVIMAHNQK